VAQFRFQAWDLNTNTLLTDLSPKGASFSERVNEAGEFAFTLPLKDPQVKATSRVVLALNGNPFKVLITTRDNDIILYSGIGWRVTRTQKGAGLQVWGKALPSYFQQVVSKASYTSDATPVDLIEAVVRDIQARPGANIWLRSRRQESNPPAAMKPSYTVAQKITGAQIIADATAAVTPGSGGVDYYTEHAFVNGVPQHTMVICAPRAGRDRTTSQATINLDAASDWSWPVDASASGNHVMVVGSGAGQEPPTAEATAAFPVGGLGQMPLLEQVLQYSQINNAAQLQAIANGAVQMYGRPVATPTVTLPVDNPVLPLGSFVVGEDALVTASPSDDFPNGLNEWWRIVAYTVTVADEGVSTMTLTLNRPPVF
jgi:hypothetical protein